MWGEGLSERPYFGGQEGGPGSSMRGMQPRQLRRMCLPPHCPMGLQWQGTATLKPCFPPCPPTAHGGCPSVPAPTRPRCHLQGFAH